MKRMENHCTTVHFSLRGSKKNSQGLSPIEVSISCNGERIYFSTGKFIKSSDWSKSKQQMKGSSQDAMLTNGYLVELRNRIYQKELELMKMGYMVTAHLIKDAVLGKLECLKERTLLQVIDEHNERKKLFQLFHFTTLPKTIKI